MRIINTLEQAKEYRSNVARDLREMHYRVNKKITQKYLSLLRERDREYKEAKEVTIEQRKYFQERRWAEIPAEKRITPAVLDLFRKKFMYQTDDKNYRISILEGMKAIDEMYAQGLVMDRDLEWLIPKGVDLNQINLEDAQKYIESLKEKSREVFQIFRGTDLELQGIVGTNRVQLCGGDHPYWELHPTDFECSQSREGHYNRDYKSERYNKLNKFLQGFSKQKDNLPKEEVKGGKK